MDFEIQILQIRVFELQKIVSSEVRSRRQFVERTPPNSCWVSEEDILGFDALLARERWGHAVRHQLFLVAKRPFASHAQRFLREDRAPEVFHSVCKELLHEPKGDSNVTLTFASNTSSQTLRVAFVIPLRFRSRQTIFQRNDLEPGM